MTLLSAGGLAGVAVVGGGVESYDAYDPVAPVGCGAVDVNAAVRATACWVAGLGWPDGDTAIHGGESCNCTAVVSYDVPGPGSVDEPMVG